MQQRFVEFLKSGLDPQIQKRLEDIAMLVLASDFIGSKDVGGAKDLVQISQVALPIYLDEFKPGEILCVNSIKDDTVRVTALSLQPEKTFDELVASSIPPEVKFEKLVTLLRTPKSKQVTVKGLAGGRMVSELPRLLTNSSSSAGSFKKLEGPVTLEDFQQTLDELKKNFVGIAEIKQIATKYVDRVLAELSRAYETTDEEITVAEEEYDRKIRAAEKEVIKTKKDLDTALEHERDNLDAKAEAEIDRIYQQLRESAAANLQTDAKNVTKKIDQLVKVSQTETQRKPTIDQLERLLTDIAIEVSSLSSSVGHSKELVMRTRRVHEDLLKRAEIEKGNAAGDCEFRKREAEGKADPIRIERETKLTELTQRKQELLNHKTNVENRRNVLIDEVERMINKNRDFVIPASELEGVPVPVTVWVKTYMFRYRKGGKDIFLFVPPLVIPETMSAVKKLPYHSSGNKTVGFELLSEGMRIYLSQFASDASRDRNFADKLQALPNLVGDAQAARTVFFDNQRLLTETLQVNPKELDKAAGRLNQVFSI